jgi:hypothetical protein
MCASYRAQINRGSIRTRETNRGGDERPIDAFFLDGLQLALKSLADAHVVTNGFALQPAGSAPRVAIPIAMIKYSRLFGYSANNARLIERGVIWRLRLVDFFPDAKRTLLCEAKC